MRRRIVAIVASAGLIAGAATVGVKAGPPTPAPAGQERLMGLTENEKLLFERINRARVNHGVERIPTADGPLSTAAHAHAADMQLLANTADPHSATNGQTPDQRIRAAAPGLLTWSENVWFVGGSDDVNAAIDSTIQGWLDSPDGHREALLGQDWDAIGVGMAKGTRPAPSNPQGPSYPYWTVTADFGVYDSPPPSVSGTVDLKVNGTTIQKAGSTGHWYYPTPGGPVKLDFIPSSRVYVLVKVKNLGTGTASGCTIAAVDPPAGWRSEPATFALAAGGQKPIPYFIRVPATAAPGTYDFKFRVAHGGDDTNRANNSGTIRIVIVAGRS